MNPNLEAGLLHPVRPLAPGVWAVAVCLLLIGAACNGEATGEDEAVSTSMESASISCDEDNGGLALPEGFCATIFADDLGEARHLSVTEQGDVYVMLREQEEEGGIVALRDSSGDGRADVVEYFGEVEGTGIGVRDGYLYVAPDDRVLRYRLSEEQLVPEGEPETIVEDLLNEGSHEAKPFAFDDEGHLYVNVGAPSNNCQEEARTPGSAGMEPCPQRDNSAGIWRFDADTPGQSQEDGYNYATGIRNAVAIDWNPAVEELFTVQHGRDQLSQLFPDYYDEEDSAELPAEEFQRVLDGADFGWPYCYYDHRQGRRVLAPEYGGDGQQSDNCSQFDEPILAFPGHYAPNDLLFYTGDHFPESYRGGAFIAFHGSWNRSPLPQEGYQVAFVPFSGQEPAGEWDAFADQFAGTDTIESPADAAHRPMGLGQGPDGSLFISDSVQGRVWRVFYNGE